MAVKRKAGDATSHSYHSPKKAKTKTTEIAGSSTPIPSISSSPPDPNTSAGRSPSKPSKSSKPSNPSKSTNTGPRKTSLGDFPVAARPRPLQPSINPPNGATTSQLSMSLETQVQASTSAKSEAASKATFTKESRRQKDTRPNITSDSTRVDKETATAGCLNETSSYNQITRTPGAPAASKASSTAEPQDQPGTRINKPSPSTTDVSTENADGLSSTQVPGKRKAAKVSKLSSSPSKRRKVEDNVSKDGQSVAQYISLTEQVQSEQTSVNQSQTAPSAHASVSLALAVPAATQANTQPDAAPVLTQANTQPVAAPVPTQTNAQPVALPASTLQQAQALGPSGGASSSASTTVTLPTAAQQVLGDSDPCPIDWTLPGLASLTQQHRDVYEMRSPWKAKADDTLENLRAELNSRYNKDVSSEAWRKLFRTANRRVYLATGKWWEREFVGLENLGLPKPGKSKKAAAPTSTSGAASGAATTSAAGTSAGTASGNAAGDAIQTQDDGQGPVRYDGEIFTIRGHDVENSDVFFRYTSISAACESSERFANAIRMGHFVYPATLDTTRQALDMFLACCAPEEKDSLSTTVYRLQGCQIIEYPVDITMSSLFQLYTLAAELRSDKVCNLVINAWRKMLVDELQSDPANGSVPGILDFSPADINSLFRSMSVRKEYPAAGTFWLDVLAIKGNSGFKKIFDDVDKYHPLFLSEWDEQLSQKQVQDLSQQQKLLGQGRHESRINHKDYESGDSDSESEDEDDSDYSDSEDSDSDSEVEEEEKASSDSCSGLHYKWRAMTRPTDKNLALTALYRRVLFLNDDFHCQEYHAGCTASCTTPITATERLQLRASPPSRPSPAPKDMSELTSSRAWHHLGSHTWEEAEDDQSQGVIHFPTLDTFVDNGMSAEERRAWLREITTNNSFWFRC